MKNLLVLAVIVVSTMFNSAIFTQDLRTDKNFIISANIATVSTNNGSTLLHQEDFILKLGEGKLCYFAFANEIFVDKDEEFVGHAKYPTLGAGISFGNETWWLFLGPGYSINPEQSVWLKNLRANIGLSLESKYFTGSALLNAGSGDWRYDMKLLYHGNNKQKKPFQIGLGLYAKTKLGYGFMGEIEPWKILVLNFGFGLDPERAVKVKTNIWVGASLVF